MAWKSGQSYSTDLRSRVLAAIDGGTSAKAAAQLFQVSLSYIYKALGRRGEKRDRGPAAAQPADAQAGRPSRGDRGRGGVAAALSSWRSANNLPAPLLMPHGQSGSPSDAGDITPGLKGTITGGSMFGSGQEVTTELEEVVDLAVAGEEPLGVPCRLEALHLPFSSSRRLVRDLGPVVQVTALAVLDPRQDLPLGRAIAAQFVRHDHTRHVLQPLEQLLEEALGRLRIAPALDQDVEHGAVLVVARQR